MSIDTCKPFFARGEPVFYLSRTFFSRFLIIPSSLFIYEFSSFSINLTRLCVPLHVMERSCDILCQNQVLCCIEYVSITIVYLVLCH